MATRIRVLAIKKTDPGPLDVDYTVTPNPILFRTQGLTKASISARFKREVQQLYENVDGKLCSLDENILSTLCNGDTIYAKLANDPESLATLLARLADDPHYSTSSDKAAKPDALDQEDTIAAHLCAAIYEDNPASAINCSPDLACISSVHVCEHRNIKYLIADTDSERFLVFRGTIAVNDWAQNSKLLPDVPFCGGFLHQGFDEYSKLFPEEAILSWLHAHGPCRKVIVAGHSLGGPLASIVTLRCLLSLTQTEIEHGTLRAVTFGAPLYATEDVCKFIEGKSWKEHFRNYILDDDLMLRVLNAHPKHKLLEAVVSLLSKGAVEGCFSVASEFMRIPPGLAKYSPLGIFHFLHSTDWHAVDCIGRGFEQSQVSHVDDVLAKCGRLELAGDRGMQGVQQHRMKEGYLPAIVQLNDTGKSCIEGIRCWGKQLYEWTPIVRSIRMQQLDTVYIVVMGMQHVGKSTFIQEVWPDCRLEGVGDGMNLTVIPKAFRLNDQVVVVDFPGINDWKELGFMTRKFMHMATFAVVLFKCEDLVSTGRFFLNEVRTHFAQEQIAIFANQADQCPEMIQNKRAVETACRSYASREHLNCQSTQMALTAMKAFDDDGCPSEQKLKRLTARGVKGPAEVRKYLQERLRHVLRTHVSLDCN